MSVVRIIILIISCLPQLMFIFLVSILLWFVPKRLRFKKIKGETVLITGAGSGLGRELASKFSRLGCVVILVDISEEGMEETSKIIEEFSSLVHRYKCDVSKREEVYRMAAKIKNDVGEVNILVNNAGVVTGKKFLDCPDHMIQKTFEVNTLAHFWTCKAFLPDMVAKNHGHVVTIASLAGMSGGPGIADYSASKHAVVGFEDSLKMELDQGGYSGINTTLVCPYLLDTGLFHGCESRVLSPLPVEYVANEIISAVQMNLRILLLPRISVFLLLMKILLPWAGVRVLSRAGGVYTFMDRFQGRKTS